MKNYYNVLGISTNSAQEEIKRAYRQLALKYHPDRNEGKKEFEEKFKEITEAYHILSDSEKKAKHDNEIKSYNQQKRSQNFQENFTPITFLIIFRNLKSKLLVEPITVNEIELFNTLNNVLSDLNLNFLISQNERKVNREIIENVLFCCIFLDLSQKLLIVKKLLKLASTDSIALQKIIDFNKRLQPSDTKQKPKNPSKTSGSSNFGCVIFIIILIIVFVFNIRKKNEAKQTHSSETTYSNENGDLNNSFIVDSASNSDLVVKSPIIEKQKLQNEKDNLLNDGWKETSINNGQMPSCYNFTPRRGKISNMLEVQVGSGTDVVIKLMNQETDKCVRYVFINSGTTYKITNIPEGLYYLKIAYGKNWFSKIEAEKCIGKFLANPLYEKGTDIMNFNIQYNGDSYSIPSYKLQLDVISTNISNTFDSQNISEGEFNI